jgi:hypothetical protein
MTGQFPSMRPRTRDSSEAIYRHPRVAHLGRLATPACRGWYICAPMIVIFAISIALLASVSPSAMGQGWARQQTPNVMLYLPSDIASDTVRISYFMIGSSAAMGTFNYVGVSVAGLAKGKKAILVLASGGVFSEGPRKSWDSVEPYLRQILGFIGIDDVQTVQAEGMNIPPIAIHAVLNGEKAVEVLVN